MKLGVSRTSSGTETGGSRPATTRQTCLQCGVMALDAATTFCRRCGLAYGAPPRASAELPTCPVCYLAVDDDGRIAARSGRGRLDLSSHIDEHRQFPVGDDDYLDTLRVGDRIRIGPFLATFDLVRRYLVTGSLDGGRRRAATHDAIIIAMGQVARWGSNAQVFGDQPEWQAARDAVTQLMERYSRVRR